MKGVETRWFSTSSRSTDWRQDVCIKSNGMFLAGIGGSVVSWKHEIVGDCRFFDLGIDILAPGHFRLAAVGFRRFAPRFMGCCNYRLVGVDHNQPVEIRSTDASRKAVGG